MLEETPSTEESSTQLSVTPAVRDADRTDAVADGGRPAPGERLFPALDDGVTLLEIEGGRGVPVVQSLVLDHLLAAAGPAVWVDAEGYATTTGMARIAPSRRLLDRIRVARAFTPYGHYAAVQDVAAAANRAVRDGSDAPSLVVAPAVDARYRGADGLDGPTARSLLSRTLARLRACGAAYDAPVLVTRTGDDAFGAPVDRVADATVTCERTRMGPRFVGADVETLLYPSDCGAYYQTTFAYWRQLLDARASADGTESASTPTAPASGGDGAAVGTGVTADGATEPLAADPVLDAWAGGAGGR